jgi:hypothetical protein
MNISVKYLIVTFLFPVFFVSCGDSVTKKEFCNDDGQQVVQEWYNDKQIKSNITYLDKSGKSYVSVKYNKEGRMIDSVTYKNDVITGPRKYYDAGSGLTHIENYKNGVPDGVMKAVFDNGVTNFEGYMVNGSKAGEWIFHYRDGRPITYEFYDLSGNIKYFRKYDDGGAAGKVTGSGIIDISLSVDKTDTTTFIKARTTLASPPGCTTELTIKNNGTKVVDTYHITKPQTEFVIPSSANGENRLSFVLTIKDEKSGETEQYSLDKTINAN